MDAYALCEYLHIEHPSRLTFSELLDWLAYFRAKDIAKNGVPLTVEEIREAMR